MTSENLSSYSYLATHGSFAHPVSSLAEPSNMSLPPPLNAPLEAAINTTPSTLSTALSSPKRRSSTLNQTDLVNANISSLAVLSPNSYEATTSSLAGALTPSPASSTTLLAPQRPLQAPSEYLLAAAPGSTTTPTLLVHSVQTPSLSTVPPSSVHNVTLSRPKPSVSSIPPLTKDGGKRRRPDMEGNIITDGFINSSHGSAPSSPSFVDNTRLPQSTIPTLAAVVADSAVTKLTPSGSKRVHGCWMCHKAFDRPSTLIKHLLVHTREKSMLACVVKNVH